MNLTHHAAQRIQQRAFPLHVIEAIVQFGRTQFVTGAESIMLDKRALRLIAERNNRLAIQMERYRGAYVVIGNNGQVIAVAHGIRRLKH
jgi:hypothetical protein